MSSEENSNPSPGYESEAMEARKVKFRDITIDALVQSDGEPSDEAIEASAKDMIVNADLPWGVLPLQDGKYLGVDCGYRYAAVLRNIQQGVPGFSPDMEIPVYVLPNVECFVAAACYRLLVDSIVGPKLTIEANYPIFIRGNAMTIVSRIPTALLEETHNPGADEFPETERGAMSKQSCVIGHKELACGDFDLAIAAFTEAISFTPDSAYAYINRGFAYGEKGEHDRAIADFSESIQLDPKNAVTYSIRGVNYEQKGEYDKAIADFNKAIRLNPKYANAYNNRGCVYDSRGELAKAIADFSAAIWFDRKLSLAYNNRGLVYYTKGEIDKAITDFSEAIWFDPDCADTYYDRGLAYERNGETAKAQKDFDAAKRLGFKPQ